jgi:hypothetical protein
MLPYSYVALKRAIPHFACHSQQKPNAYPRRSQLSHDDVCQWLTPEANAFVSGYSSNLCRYSWPTQSQNNLFKRPDRGQLNNYPPICELPTTASSYYSLQLPLHHMTLTINPPSPRVRGAVTPAAKPVKSTPPPLPVLAHVARHVDNEAPILKRFMYGIEYHPPSISGTNEKLETAMRSEMHEREIQCAQLERTLHLAASFVEVRSPTPVIIFSTLPLHF